ncbi:MAG: DODA-type extradiol aromatic ring-opening family dioxygenase [Pelagimonas sp.]|uniref:DODA-type extradiol aromatic ring-opening family dioxygenase n=1 Tax=Pelagimonas sp. TaxID=2073170 RepID=UPI003D6A6401
MTKTNTLPTYFISHGGGPWPWIPQMRETFAPLEASLKQMIADHGAPPKAILMISGHWEEDEVAIMGAAKPPMLYDYSGFPPHTYDITYDAPGAPDIAARTLSLLQNAGISAHIDTDRGFDHGLFAPMEIMYPKADMPIFQVSMLKSYDPADHIAIGRALKPLRDEGIMIVGSGLSFHNLRLFRGGGEEASAQFDAWLYDAMSARPDARREAILKWETAPAARICHREEDHLVPLFVALGAAENEPATRIFHDVSKTLGITVSNYKFG